MIERDDIENSYQMMLLDYEDVKPEPDLVKSFGPTILESSPIPNNKLLVSKII